MVNQPECFHIPPLYEGQTVPIDWSGVVSPPQGQSADGVVSPPQRQSADGGESAVRYLIERNFNESFDQALTGYSWENLDHQQKSWAEYDQEALTWRQIEARTGWGQTFERLDYKQLSWSQIEAMNQNWRQLEHQEINFEIYRGPGVKVKSREQGRTWTELEEPKPIWNVLDAVGQTWAEWEQVTLPGIAWECLDANWLSFDEWDAKDLTFDQLEERSSNGENRGITDRIPIGAKSAIYRIKAYNAEADGGMESPPQGQTADGGEESAFLTTSQLPVIPLFYRDSVMNYPVKEGQSYRILLKARDLYGLGGESAPQGQTAGGGIRMNLSYHPELLALVDFSVNASGAAHHPGKIVEAGNYPDRQLTLYSVIPGKVWFQSTKTLKPEEAFSGALSLVEFVAKRTGWATISLS